MNGTKNYSFQENSSTFLPISRVSFWFLLTSIWTTSFWSPSSSQSLLSQSSPLPRWSQLPQLPQLLRSCKASSVAGSLLVCSAARSTPPRVLLLRFKSCQAGQTRANNNHGCATFSSIRLARLARFHSSSSGPNTSSLHFSRTANQQRLFSTSTSLRGGGSFLTLPVSSLPSAGCTTKRNQSRRCKQIPHKTTPTSTAFIDLSHAQKLVSISNPSSLLFLFLAPLSSMDNTDNTSSGSDDEDYDENYSHEDHQDLEEYDDNHNIPEPQHFMPSDQANNSITGSSIGSNVIQSGTFLGRRFAVAITGATSLLLCVVLAKLGLIPGYSSDVGGNDRIVRDVVLTIITTLTAYGFVKLNTYGVAVGALEPRDARKIIHTFSAPLFILLWPFFSVADGARYFAAIVPTINAVRLFLAANSATTKSALNVAGDVMTTTTNPSTTYTKTTKGDELAVAISRSGDIREALGGPFIYVIMLLAATILFWTNTVPPVGIVALSCMAAGDGMADLVGRRLGKYTFNWPIGDRKKSLAGSLAFFVSSIITASFLLLWLQYWTSSATATTVSLTPTHLIDPSVFLRVVLVSAATCVLEVVPLFGGVDDNYVVPISAVLLSLVLFQGM